MFAVLLIALMFCQGLAAVSYGDSFITAFPENMGFFYPYGSNRSIRVTALYADTVVTVSNTSDSSGRTIPNLQAGTTVTVSFPHSAEFSELNSSTSSVRITSNKNIVVHSVSQIDIIPANSVQVNVVQPVANLGTYYLIPSLNYTNFLSAFSISVSGSNPRRFSSFRLIVINAEDLENSVTIVRKISGTFREEHLKLPSYQLVQMEADPTMKKIKSSHKIAVLLTLPCLETQSCKCNMVLNQILPTQFQGQNFVVPSIPDITESLLHVTSDSNTYSLTQNKNKLSPSALGFLSLPDPTKTKYVTASGNVSLRLISPGLIIELIPDNMFAACFLLHFYSTSKEAFVIAKSDSKDKLHTHNGVVTGAQWTAISGTKYSSAIITLTDATAVIWHPTSKIGVYILEKSATVVYGGPAMVINEKPDQYGCALIAGGFEVGRDSLSWTESLKYCTDQQKQFACPAGEDIQTELANSVTTDDEGGWIGLRRSLLTTDWYWKTDTTSASPSVDYVHWAKGHPQDKLRGFCASLSNKDDFKWKSARCCEKKLPVCYQGPTYLTASNPSHTEQF